MKRVYLVLLVLVLFCVLNGCSTEKTNISIESGSIISNLINDSWSIDSIKNQFGESDSYFEDYEIYFDDGVSVKYSEIYEVGNEGWEGYNFSRSGNVENVVFNDKYIGDILSGIGINSNVNTVQKTLGKPEFIDKELNVLGYRTEHFYIFFVGSEGIDEVSVYPRYQRSENDVVSKAAELCIGREYTIGLAVELNNMIKRELGNYNYYYNILGNARYSQRKGSCGAAYYSDGIEIFYSEKSNNDKPMLTVYSNYSGEINEENYLITDSDGKVLVQYIDDADLVFEVEKSRIENKNMLNEAIKTDGVVSPNGEKLLVDNMSSDGIDVIDLTRNEPNYCIETSPFQYDAGKWLDDRYFVYSYGKGDIRVYDLIDNKDAKIAGSSMIIRDVKNGEIIFDLSTVSIYADHRMKYEFNENNEPVFWNEYGNKIGLVWNDGRIYNSYTKSLNDN